MFGTSPGSSQDLWPGYNGSLGTPMFKLTAGVGTTTPFRNALTFRIHADYGPVNFSYNASSGCIVLNLAARSALKSLVSAYGGANLHVKAY